MTEQPAPVNPAPVRRRCTICYRPPGYCLCHLLPSITPATRLLVIQHPAEQKHALNTGRLLVAGLTNAHLLIAEQLPVQWRERLADPGWHTELLFPGPQIPLVGPAIEDERPRCLVLLDGTWRKARKLLYANSVLQSLPRVALPDGLTSRYRLRKAPGPGALSTIEAAVAALQILEPRGEFAGLLAPFDALIEGQIRAMGQNLYQRNYQDACKAP